MLHASGAFEIGAYHEQSGKAPFADDFDRRAVVKRAVARAHPGVDQIAVVREQQAQIFMDAE